MAIDLETYESLLAGGLPSTFLQQSSALAQVWRYVATCSPMLAHVGIQAVNMKLETPELDHF